MFIIGAATGLLLRYAWGQSLSRLGAIDLELTDTHLHLIDLKKFTYPRLEEVPLMRNSFSAVDFSKAAQQANIGKYILWKVEHYRSKSYPK